MKQLKQWFQLTNREQKGVLALIGLIFALFLSVEFYVYLSPIVKDQHEIHLALKSLSVANQEGFEKEYFKSKRVKNGEKHTIYQFDPNLISQTEWEKFGLSPKQAAAIISYRGKGGKFYKVEDLKKMYTISPEMYERLSPFVRIAVPQDQPAELKNRVEKISIREKIDLNEADSAALVSLNGVGPTFARRIIAYRQRLGGFHSLSQLNEVYGIDSLNFSVISGQLHLSNQKMQLIDLNHFTFEQLKSNPYLRYKQIYAIIEYRKQHGHFKDVDELRKIPALNESTIEKIKPYLTIQND